jgi:hypothetical protein
MDYFFISQTILMIHTASEHNGNNIHILVWMKPKSFTGSYKFIIKNLMQPKSALQGVGIAGKNKSEIALQPSNVFVASLGDGRYNVLHTE